MSQIEINVEELRTAIASFQMELNNYKNIANNYKTTADKFGDMNSNFCNQMKEALNAIKDDSTDSLVVDIEHYIEALKGVVESFNSVDEEAAASIQGA